MSDSFTAASTTAASSHGPLHQELPEEAANPYHVLQVRCDATPSEIREAYRRLALWHHPGRSIHHCDAERNRRAQAFLILAACYETLMDNEVRKRFDVLIENAEMTTTIPAGKIHVGGRRVVASNSPTRKQQQRMACGGFFGSSPHKQLCPAATNDSSIYRDGGSTVGFVPALANSSESSLDEEDEIHYTEDETNRLFGGPLSQMYKARNYESFTDPVVVFDTVFGSGIFHMTDEKPSSPRETTTARLPMRSPTRSSAWHGTSTTQKDGTIVSRTTRVLFDRKMTRTETITVDPTSKKRHSQVTVTSEELTPIQQAQQTPQEMCSCIACGGKSHRSVNVVDDELAVSGDANHSMQYPPPPLLYLEHKERQEVPPPDDVWSQEYWAQVCDVVRCCEALFPE